MKAPRLIDMPLIAVITPVPMTTSRHAAMKNSVEPAAATWWKSGRSRRRPPPTSSNRPAMAGSSV